MVTSEIDQVFPDTVAVLLVHDPQVELEDFFVRYATAIVFLTVLPILILAH